MIKKNAIKELELLFENSGGRIIQPPSRRLQQPPSQIIPTLPAPPSLKPKEKTIWNRIKHYDYSKIKKIASGIGLIASIALLLLKAYNNKKSKRTFEPITFDDEELPFAYPTNERLPNERSNFYIPELSQDYLNEEADRLYGYGGRILPSQQSSQPSQPSQIIPTLPVPSNLNQKEKSIWNKIKDYDYSKIKKIASGIGATALVAGLVLSGIKKKRQAYPVGLMDFSNFSDFEGYGGRILPSQPSQPPSQIIPTLPAPPSLKPKEKTLWNKIKNYDYSKIKKIALGVGTVASIALLLLKAYQHSQNKPSDVFNERDILDDEPIIPSNLLHEPALPSSKWSSNRNDRKPYGFPSDETFKGAPSKLWRGKIPSYPSFDINRSIDNSRNVNEILRYPHEYLYGDL